MYTKCNIKNLTDLCEIDYWQKINFICPFKNYFHNLVFQNQTKPYYQSI